MADRSTKGFVFYNSMSVDVIAKVSSFSNPSESVSIKILKNTYSETVNLTKFFTSESRVMFEILDANTKKSYGSPGTLDVFIYSSKGDAYIFDISIVNRILLLGIKDLCFKAVSFYTGALAVVRYQIYKYPPNTTDVTLKKLGEPYWKSSLKLITQTETIDLNTLKIPDMSLIALRVEATLGSGYTADIPIIYSNNTFRIAGFKSTGTIFSIKLVVNQ